jgi:signal transduction histidine kinase
LFALSLLVLFSFAAYMINQLRRAERTDLKLIARSIERHIEQLPDDPRQTAPAAFKQIDQHVSFADADGDLAYAVFSRDGQLVHRSADFSDQLPDDGPPQSEQYRLFWGLHSPESWHFLLYYNSATHIILVSDWRHVELLEEVLISFGVSTCLVLTLSIIFGMILSGKVTQPITDIAQTADRVRAGDLTARIPEASGKDEIAHLKSTLNNTFMRLEESFNRISQFSYDAAHELKTPLTAIRGNLEVCINRQRSPEEYQETIAGVIEEIAALNRIIDDLLLLAKSGEEYRDNRCTHQDLSGIVQDMVASLNILAEEKNIQLRSRIAPSIRVQGVETFLRRIASNLIHNAIKYTDPGGHIDVSLTTANGAAVLTVRDDGIGMDPSLCERIFDRLYQIDASRNRGAGLGLAIVKWIVTWHQGTIEVESQPGQGAVFTVKLPAAQQQ